MRRQAFIRMKTQNNQLTGWKCCAILPPVSWHQGDKPIVLSLAMKIAGFAIPRMAVGVIPITSAVKHGESMPQGFTPCIAWAERNGSAIRILSDSTGRNAGIGTFGSESLPRWPEIGGGRNSTALLRLYGAHNWDCVGVIRSISRSRCEAHQCNPQLCYRESLVTQQNPAASQRCTNAGGVASVDTRSAQLGLL